METPTIPKYKFDIYNRRSKWRGENAIITVEEWRALLTKYDNRCLCCGVQSDKLQPDHIIPFSKKGPNTIDNIQPLCKSCNSKKGVKTIDYRPKRFNPLIQMLKRLQSKLKAFGA